MVKRILHFLGRETSGLHQAAYVLGFFTLLSQLLALIRDRLFAGYFGAGEILDLYYASFRIPDLIFVTVSSLVSVTVLIPALSRLNSKEEEQSLISSISTIFVLLMAIVCTIAYIGMPIFVKNIVPGIENPMLIVMSRLLLLSPFILGLSNLCGGIVQTKHRFVAYALSPVFYNVGIILGLLILYPYFGIIGLTIGVVLGSFMHLAIQVPTLHMFHTIPTLTWRINWRRVGDVLKMSVPRTLTLTSGHIVNIGMIALGSLMAVGSISIFTFALNMQSVPLSIIGVSYSLAAFPTLSKLWSDKNTKLFFEELSAAAKHVLFWSIPIIILFIVLRAQIVRTVYGAGLFNWEDTRLTAAALALFSISLVGQNITLLCIRAHYAMGHTLKPFLYALIGGIVSLFVAYGGFIMFSSSCFACSFFESLLKVGGLQGTEVLVLPLAFSIGSLIQATLLWFSMPYTEFRHAFNITKSVFQSFGASIIMGFVSYKLLGVLDNVFNINTLHGIFLQGFLAGLGGIFIGVILLVFLQNKEIETIGGTLRSRLWKAKPITEGQDELL